MFLTEPVNEVIVSKESPAVESIVVQSEPEESSKQVNGDLQTKEDVQTSTEALFQGTETATPVLAVEKTSKETKKEGKKSKKGKALVTNAIMNCYKCRMNDFQTLEIQEDHGKNMKICSNASFVRTFLTVA